MTEHDEVRRTFLKLTGVGVAALGVATAVGAPAIAQDSAEWDKTFPKSDKPSTIEKVTFKNRYGITLAGRHLSSRRTVATVGLPAIVVSVARLARSRSSPLVFTRRRWPSAASLQLAFDPSYTGESGGEPRNVASPDINTEDFSAAVDYHRPAPRSRSRTDRRHRHLRLGWYGPECRRSLTSASRPWSPAPCTT